MSKLFFSIQLIIMILVKHGKYEKTMEMIDQKMTIGWRWLEGSISYPAES